MLITSWRISRKNTASTKYSSLRSWCLGWQNWLHYNKRNPTLVKRAVPAGRKFSFEPGSCGDQRVAKNISIKNFSFIKMIHKNPDGLDFADQVWHVIKVNTRVIEKFKKYVTGKDVQAAIDYPIPLYHQKAYSQWCDDSYLIPDKIHEQIILWTFSAAINRANFETVYPAINSCTL